MTISGDSIRFCAHPVRYDTVRLKVPGFAITPHFDRLTIEPQQQKAVRFLARKIVNVSGRVMRRDGTAHGEQGQPVPEPLARPPAITFDIHRRHAMRALRRSITWSW